jgi:replicative DNA helicase
MQADTLAEHGSDKGPKTPVTAVTILAASRIGAYFKANAINAFIEMGTDQGTADAVYLLDRIESAPHPTPMACW